MTDLLPTLDELIQRTEEPQERQSLGGSSVCKAATVRGKGGVAFRSLADTDVQSRSKRHTLPILRVSSPRLVPARKCPSQFNWVLRTSTMS